MPVTQTTPLHIANILEAMADAVGDRTHVFTVGRTYSYAEIDDRATRFANRLLETGIQPGDHVGIHAPNRIEWIDAFYGCFKAGAVPINVNYKYLHGELAYLYDNADCVAAVLDPQYLDMVKGLDLPDLQHLVVMDDSWEDDLAAASAERPDTGRSEDDHYILYTGGTTGQPKGVVWRQADIIRAALNASRLGAPIESVQQLAEEAAANESPMVLLACGPMMHGGSQWILGNGLTAGYTVSLFTEPSFSAEKILDLVQAAGVNSLTFLGDAMGRPVAEAILAEPDRWDLSSLVAVSNGAAPLSDGVRAEIRKALPGRFILDSYGASESGAAGSKLDDGSTENAGAPKFDVNDDVEVLDPISFEPCPPGVDGMLARSGPVPLGYYKDETKTAATFKEYGGRRWVIPGDMARREDDGSVTLLGRGSVCINTGGEKVHPEEVEAVLLRHDDIFDAAVVGTDHPRWGQQVTALVQLRDGVDLNSDQLSAFCHGLIANYKVPKEFLFVDQVPRTPVSKVDYKRSAELAAELLA